MTRFSAANEVYEIKLTTSGQGLHDSSLRQVGIADAADNILSTALINDGEVDGITNRSIIYQANSSAAMTKLRNGETPTPAVLLTEQVAGPATPSNLTATPSNQSITLTWEASAGAVSYTIYHSDGTTTFSGHDHNDNRRIGKWHSIHVPRDSCRLGRKRVPSNKRSPSCATGSSGHRSSCSSNRT